MTASRRLALLLLSLVCCARADIDYAPDSSTSGAESSAGHAADAAPSPAPAAATASCDTRQISCRRAAPACPEGQVPSVSGGCYGECVALERCACNQADDCPNRDSYTCHMYARHCGPYVH